MSNTSESHIDGLAIENLRCEFLTNPMGIDAASPRMSWELTSDRNGAHAVASRVVADCWESGWTGTGDTMCEYSGPSLRSGQRVRWQVDVRDDVGNITTSDAAWFEMGLLTPQDWTSNWIGAPLDWPTGADTPTRYFRSEFTLSGTASRARLYITALGVYVASINGQRVGNDAFTPGWTDYHHRLQYQTYDVTDLLTTGANVITVELADGWYAGYVGFLGREIYGTRPELFAQLLVEHDHGATTTIVTDGTWRVATGGRLAADQLMGETIDARLAPTRWPPVAATNGTTSALVGLSAPPTRATMEITPLSCVEHAPGVWIVDVGQNLSGWARLRANGPAGTEVVLRFAEVLDTDGSLYTANLRDARATDHFILAGTGHEVFEPTFTFHGFRYIEVAGYPGALTTADITAVVCTADLATTGTFDCDDAVTNQLQSNIVWGQRGNFLEVPTDCPQRDERMGWTGDAQVFAPTACFNMDVSAFLGRWMVDMVDAQADDGAFSVVVPRLSGENPDENDGAPGWGDAGVIVPWNLFRRYGDRRLLERCFPAMVRWIDHIHDANPDLLWRNKRHGDMGDWLSINADSPKEVLGSSFFAHSADLVARAADALGRSDAATHRERADAIRAAYNATYVNADGTIEGDTQTIYALALRFGLLDDDTAARTATRLVADIEARDYHLSTGFLGVAHLLPALTDAGFVDVAYRLLHQDTSPSWGYPIKHGATTIWERWDGWTEADGFQDPAMNSFNHYAFGAVGEWLYETVAGIRPTGPGYESVLIAPQPGGRIHRVDASYRSVRGPIAVHWERNDERFRLDVEISPACEAAEVRVPSDAGDEIHVVGSGRHRFETMLTR